MTDIGFQPWPKIHRLTGNTARMVITEKIDGTNGQILLWEGSDGGPIMRVGSRKRWITPDDDNFGFAAWAYENQDALWDLLGPGRHYGEWYGKGIQRGYGLDERRFALFNVHRWNHTIPPNDIGLEVVPTLYDGEWDYAQIDRTLGKLRAIGSCASLFWENPEGIIVQHLPSRHTYKVLLENNDLPKSALDRMAAAA